MHTQMVRVFHVFHAVAAIAAVIVGGSVDVCDAATYTWIGNSPANWFDGGITLLDGNWDPNPAGASLLAGDSLVFDGQGDIRPDQNGNAQITNLTFSGGSYELGSTTSSTLTISGVLLQDSPLPQRINNRVEFATGAVVNTSVTSDELTLGVLAGSGNFTKVGSSTLRLLDASAYSGTTTISAGFVFDDGPTFGGSIVLNGGVFVGDTVAGSFEQSNGTGSFRIARSVHQTGGNTIFVSGTVTESSTLSGTNSITGATGLAMTFGSDLTLGSGNITTFDLGSAGLADEYVVNGLLTYGGSMTFNFTTAGTATIGTTWSVFDPNGGVSGSFAGISGTGAGPYAGLTWSLASSSTNDFDQRYGDGVWLSSWRGSGASAQRLIFNQATGNLTVVPEPSTFVMAGAGIAGCILLRWRRKYWVARCTSGDPAAVS